MGFENDSIGGVELTLELDWDIEKTYAPVVADEEGKKKKKEKKEREEVNQVPVRKRMKFLVRNIRTI